MQTLCTDCMFRIVQMTFSVRSGHENEIPIRVFPRIDWTQTEHNMGNTVVLECVEAVGSHPKINQNNIIEFLNSKSQRDARPSEEIRLLPRYATAYKMVRSFSSFNLSRLPVLRHYTGILFSCYIKNIKVCLWGSAVSPTSSRLLTFTQSGGEFILYTCAATMLLTTR